MKLANSAALELRTHGSIGELGCLEWGSLTDAGTPPFLHFEWLQALENSGCVSAANGWLPLFLSLWYGGELVAAAPAYVKGHSMGEFVFDQAWARFSEESLGAPYYPKLVVAVPFTPATGPRLLFNATRVAAHGLSEQQLYAGFGQGLARLAELYELSGSHVLFLPEQAASTLASLGMCHRHGVQFHWTNPGYARFDDFLARFSSKKRHQLRRERRELEEQGLRLEVATGSDISVELMDHVYQFYRNTVDRFFWGRQYLNRAFFEEVAATMPDRLHIVLAYPGSSRKPIAGAFNLLGQQALYGRYWGATEQYRFLHFNVCFYQGIEECIERGLKLFEPGAGGEHKLARGFEATLTHSVHHLSQPVLKGAVDDFLARERQAVARELEQAKRDAVLRPMEPAVPERPPGR